MAHLRLATDRDWLIDVVRFVAARRRGVSGGALLGYTTQRQEITRWFVGAALLAGFVGLGLALFWSNRLV